MGFVRVAGIAILVAISACSSPSPGGASLDVSASWWELEADGDVKVGAGTSDTGTRAEIDDDLGITRDETWSGRIDVTNGPNRIGIEYLPLELGGDAIVSDSFLFHGSRYEAGEHVSTDLALETWVLKWDYSASTSRRSEDAFRVGAGLWWWSMDAQVKSNSTGTDERRSFSKLYPGIHGTAVFDLGHGLLGELAGSIALNGADRRIYDLGGSVGYRVSDAIKLSLGYRWMKWDVDEGSTELDFSLRGPLAALTLRF